MVLCSEDAGGTAFAEPAALTPEWLLKLDAPFKTPHRSSKHYLPGILTGVLKNTAGWSTSWCGQILSAAAWLQVVLLSGFKRTTAVIALHGAIHRAYCGSPHPEKATVTIMHHLSYHMPAKRCVVVSAIKCWLGKHANMRQTCGRGKHTARGDFRTVSQLRELMGPRAGTQRIWTD